MGITIKDAQIVRQVSGKEKIPVSDDSGLPRAVTTEQVKEYILESVNTDVVQSDWNEDNPTSGAYIKNKPYIPNEVTEKTIEGWGFTKNTGTYSKPTDGIPKDDLSSGVRASLDKAETALQTHQDISYLATKTELEGKVDKVNGKQLSTEDFTTLLKQKLDSLSNYDDTEIQETVTKLRTDLDTLVSGDTTTAIKTFNEVIAFLNGISDTENLSGIIASIEQQIAAKAGKSEIPTKVSQLENDEGYITSHQDISHLATKTELEGLEDTIPTKVSQLENDSNYVQDDIMPENGIYIYDIDGNLTLPNNWNTANNSKAVGVAVLSDSCRFIVAKEDATSSSVAWGGFTFDIPSLTEYSDLALAATDFNGAENTVKIVSAVGSDIHDGNRLGSAAGDCRAYTFSNGKTGYLGSAGEWDVVQQHHDEIDSALILIGGTPLIYGDYWTSTEYDNYYAWVQYLNFGGILQYEFKNDSSYNVRAFLSFAPIKPVKQRITDLEQRLEDLVDDVESVYATEEYVNSAISSAITTTLNTAV